MECNRQCSYRTPYGYCSVTQCYMNLGTTYAEPRHFKKEKKMIEKKELKEWIENWFTTNKYYHPYSKSNNIPINELYDILEHMPTVDAERLGHWITKEEEREVKGTITPVYWCECSLCGEKPLYTDNGIWVFSNYCPNCGAKMDEVEEDE